MKRLKQVTVFLGDMQKKFTKINNCIKKCCITRAGFCLAGERDGGGLDKIIKYAGIKKSFIVWGRGVS